MRGSVKERLYGKRSVKDPDGSRESSAFGTNLKSLDLAVAVASCEMFKLSIWPALKFVSQSFAKKEPKARSF